MKKPSKYKLCFAVTVWGQKYIDTFLTYSLPSLMSGNNIPSLVANDEFEFLIRTSEENVEYILGSGAIEILKKYIKVDIKGFEPFLFKGGETEDRYWRMSSLHREIISYCAQINAGIVFLPSDVIWADGTICNMQKIIEEKKPRVIVMCTLRSQEIKIKNYLDSNFLLNSEINKIITISSRELVRIALDNPHEITKSRFIDSSRFTTVPAHIYWRLGNEGLLARGAHLHPLYVHPQHYTLDFRTTYDADFLSMAVPNPEDYHVCDDSDILFFSDLTAAGDLSGILKKPAVADEKRIASWIAKHTGPAHRTFLNTPIWIHTGIDKTVWAEQLEETKIFNNAVQPQVELFSNEIEKKNKENSSGE